MYSVIIPTLWKCSSFPNFLSSLNNVDLIDEIIIIDNDTQKRPESISNLSKVLLLPQKENIGVNPAWNLGVKISKNKKLAILNDDLEFNLDVFNFMKDHVREDYGMIGIDLQITDFMRLENVNNLSYAFACLFFIHKESYINIPETIKIFYGDNWLLDINKFLGKQNKKIFGVNPKGHIEFTSRNFSHFMELDRKNFQNEINNFISKKMV